MAAKSLDVYHELKTEIENLDRPELLKLLMDYSNAGGSESEVGFKLCYQQGFYDGLKTAFQALAE